MIHAQSERQHPRGHASSCEIGAPYPRGYATSTWPGQRWPSRSCRRRGDAGPVAPNGRCDRDAGGGPRDLHNAHRTHVGTARKQAHRTHVGMRRALGLGNRWPSHSCRRRRAHRCRARLSRSSTRYERVNVRVQHGRSLRRSQWELKNSRDEASAQASGAVASCEQAAMQRTWSAVGGLVTSAQRTPRVLHTGEPCPLNAGPVASSGRCEGDPGGGPPRSAPTWVPPGSRRTVPTWVCDERFLAPMPASRRSPASTSAPSSTRYERVNVRVPHGRTRRRSQWEFEKLRRRGVGAGFGRCRVL